MGGSDGSSPETVGSEAKGWEDAEYRFGWAAVAGPGSLAAVPAVEPEIRELTPADAMERVLSEGVHWLGQTYGPTLALAREALEDYTRARLAGDIKLTLAAREQVMRLFGKLGFDPDARARLVWPR